jgi:hypothetical protein
MDSRFLGKDQFIWWKGVVEDRKDPIMLGRVKVRIFGWHSEDKQKIPPEELPWAAVSIPFDNGRNPVGLKEGDWVWGFFMDGPEAQRPIVCGYIPGIDEKPADLNLGFGDPTKPEDISPDSHPRPPDLSAQASGGESEDSQDTSGEAEKKGRFYDEEKVPGNTSVFGELAKTFDPENCKYDLNKDGSYDVSDAGLIIQSNISLFRRTVFGGGSGILATIGIVLDSILKLFNPDGTPKDKEEINPPTLSPYPLQDRLMEPVTSRLSRNENIDQTIVGLKKGMLETGEAAGYDSSGVGLDTTVEPAAFEEPETPYDAKYPFNHVYESESGHFIEVDDTPGAERLHWYHRSGTFREIHPDGTQVTKVKKSDYNFVIEDYFLSSAKNINASAMEAVKIKGTTGIILNSGANLMQQVGENLTTNVDKDAYSRIKGGTYSLIEDISMTHVGAGAYLCVKDGELHIKAAKTIVIESDEKVQIKSKVGIDLCAPDITMQGFGGGFTTVNMVSFEINSLFLVSHLAVAAIPAIHDFYPGIPIPSLVEKNKADNEDWYKETTEDASLKYGFLIPEGGIGAVWKPISDSDKNLVTLSEGMGEHKLFEAIPTGELEPVYIKYAHPDGQITEWEVVRPKHIRGAEITNMFGAPRADVFLDGRRMWRWPKPGKAYPKQLIWDIVGVTDVASAVTPLIILDSAVRHQCLTGAQMFDRIIEDFDVTKPGPEAGSEEAGSASPKFGYLFPTGAIGDVYKPTSESNGNLCTLSHSGSNHELYEAVDTGETEAIKVKYLQISGTTTEWIETRPVFVRGKLLDKPVTYTTFEGDGRHLCRWGKPGAQYPKNMFLVIKNGSVEKASHFIVNAASRHQFNAAYDPKVESKVGTTAVTATSTEAPGQISQADRDAEITTRRASINSTRGVNSKTYDNAPTTVSVQDKKTRSKKA